MTLADTAQTPWSTTSETVPQSVETSAEQAESINVGSTERLISGLAGAALIAAGLSRRSIPGLVVAGLGGMVAWRGVSGHCAAYDALGIDTTDRDTDGAPPEAYFKRGLHFSNSFTISNKSPQELYAYWREFENFPRIFRHLEQVRKLDEKRSHWVAVGPMDRRFEWDAEIINDEPDTVIAWRSLANADVDNAGSVRFVQAPAGRGTELKVVLDYIPPAGAVGRTIAMLMGQDPEHQIREDLRRFKRIMECGEAPGTEGQPRGTCGGS